MIVYAWTIAVLSALIMPLLVLRAMGRAGWRRAAVVFLGTGSATMIMVPLYDAVGWLPANVLLLAAVPATLLFLAGKPALRFEAAWIS